MRKYFFIIGLFVVMLSACRSTRQVVQQTQKDSTSVSFREVEKIVRVPGDTVYMKVPVLVQPSISSGSGAIFKPIEQTVENKRAKVKLSVNSSGQIEVTSICKELEEKVSFLEKTITIQRSEIKEYQIKESKFNTFVNNIKKYVKFAFFSIAAITILWLIIKIGSPLKYIKSLLQ